MRNITGPPVSGSNFFGRQKEIEYVWQSLKDGNNILLPSPRRVGKSSFAKKLLSIAKEEGWEIIELNLEKIDSEPELVRSFIQKLKELKTWEQVKERAENLWDRIRPTSISVGTGEASVSAEWKKQKKKVYRDFDALLNHDVPTLIFFDEVAVLLNHILAADKSIAEVEHLLHWLRDLRQTEDSRIRWIYCSSIGIENFTHQHGMSDTVNDFESYKLRAFDRETSTALIEALEEDKKLVLTPDLRHRMVDKIDYCLPFFLQVLFKQMKGLHQTENAAVNGDLLDKAYQELLTQKDLNTWIERLEKQYPEKGRDAHTVLKHICREKTGSKRSNLKNTLIHHYQDEEQTDVVLAKLLHMLTNDGYLMEEEDLYRFRSPLLRDFWHQRFVK